MKRWHRRRSVAGLQPAPLTPAQVQAIRAKDASRSLWIMRVYLGVAVFASVSFATFFHTYGAGEYEPVARIFWVLALVWVLAMVATYLGRGMAAASIAIMLGTAALVPTSYYLSLAPEFHINAFGLGFASFIIIRSDRTLARLWVGLTVLSLFLFMEFAFSASPESAIIAMPPDLADSIAHVNRVSTAFHVTTVAILLQYRFRLTRRTLEGAARYGELRATTDELTGVYNRRPVIEQLSTWAKRGHGNYAIALVDVDNFKTVNDVYGHDCGDALIRAVASTMRDHFRETDMVSRWGGDEFLVLMPGMRGADLVPVLERLRRSVLAIEKNCEGHAHTVTISVGAAMGSPEQTPDECIASADHALYRAKAEGRNRVIAVGVATSPSAVARGGDAEPWRVSAVKPPTS